MKFSASQKCIFSTGDVCMLNDNFVFSENVMTK